MRTPINPISRRDFLAAAGTVGTGMSLAAQNPVVVAAPIPPEQRPGQQRVFDLKAPPLEKGRIGMIGMGVRGSSLLSNLLDIEHVEIKAVYDILPDRVKRAQQSVAARGRPEPAGYGGKEHEFEKLCRRADLDAEQTRRHCLILENCCYGEIELLVLRLAHQGVLGDLTHAEAGYLHEARDYLLQGTPDTNCPGPSIRRTRRHGLRHELASHPMPPRGAAPRPHRLRCRRLE